MNKKNNNLSLPAYIFYFLFLSFSLLLSPSSAASPDAIAIRIIPNPEHYSPLRWYINQGFKGSPQALTVDGYEAIRDGRTVYINSANVSLDNTKIYTNIYLISYNQEAEAATTDIFSRLLAHWKFNANIAANAGKCSKSNETDCLSNSECLSKGYCTSPKANIIRDTKRLSDLVEIKIALEEYKKKTGHYPTLSAGSYLPNKTVSTWPSWKETLGKELGGNLPIDPINEMGACVGYDAITCWNETTKRFNDPDLNDGKFQLPEDSKAFVYSTDANGLSYGICSVMESGLISVDNGGGCVGSATNVGFNPVLKNNPPQVSCGAMNGAPLSKFSGYINIFDADNDKLSVALEPITPDNWNNWGWTWDAGFTKLAVKNSGAPTQKEITAQKAGPEGDYKFRVNVSDGKQNVSAECPIKIKTFSVKINNSIKNAAQNIDLFASSTLKINKNILTAWQPTSTNYPLIGTIVGGSFPNGIIGQMKQKASIFTYFIEGILSPSPANIFNQLSQVFNLIVEIKDTTGGFSNSNFKITVINNPPKINPINCAADLRVTTVKQNNYPQCVITADDSNIKNENNKIVNFAVNNLPADNNLTANFISNTLTINGFSKNTGNYPITVTATDEFGATGQGNFNLKVKSYCGDGILNNPNDENRGGPADSGQENCDITAGIATGPADSAANRQYACTTSSSASECPLNGGCVGTCKFKDGWCGDGVLQAVYGEQCDDGNAVDGDGCNTNTAKCKYVCGDKHPDPGEQCDDGNNISGDGCNSAASNCQYVCGDGILTGAEQCDPAGSTKVCQDPMGMPAYCDAISGTQTCAANCTWGGCVAPAPAIVANNFGDCNNNITYINYSCCEITACKNDACCDGDNGTDAPVPVGYLLKNTVNNSEGNGNCKVSQLGNSWAISVTHTTNAYRCWQ